MVVDEVVSAAAVGYSTTITNDRHTIRAQIITPVLVKVLGREMPPVRLSISVATLGPVMKMRPAREVGVGVVVQEEAEGAFCLRRWGHIARSIGR